MKLDEKTGLLILAAGGPSTVDDVEPFSQRVFADPHKFDLPWYRAPFRVSMAKARAEARAEELRQVFEHILVDSPLLRVTGGQANRTAELLGCLGYAAMRLSPPSTDEAIGLMLEEGIERVVVINGVPAYSRAWTKSHVEDFSQAWRRANRRPEDLMIIDRWCEEPAYIEAWCSIIAETLELLRGEAAHVVFVAPGLGGHETRYVEDLQRTLNLVLAGLSMKHPHSLAFLAPWTGEPAPSPTPEEIIDVVSSNNTEHLVVVPLGFIADQIDTLYDIDHVMARRANSKRLRTYRVPTPNDCPELVAALASIVKERVMRLKKSEAAS